MVTEDDIRKVRRVAFAHRLMLLTAIGFAASWFSYGAGLPVAVAQAAFAMFCVSFVLGMIAVVAVASRIWNPLLAMALGVGMYFPFGPVFGQFFVYGVVGIGAVRFLKKYRLNFGVLGVPEVELDRWERLERAKSESSTVLDIPAEVL